MALSQVAGILGKQSVKPVIQGKAHSRDGRVLASKRVNLHTVLGAQWGWQRSCRQKGLIRTRTGHTTRIAEFLQTKGLIPTWVWAHNGDGRVLAGKRV